MEHKRLLELALQTLERQKAEVAAEIESIQAELNGAGFSPAMKVKPVAPTVRKRRSRTRAERKALSRRMKEIWAAKKLQAAKSVVAAKAVPAKAKGRPKSAAEKKALSLKMKQVWAKRKAEAAKK